MGFSEGLLIISVLRKYCSALFMVLKKTVIYLIKASHFLFGKDHNNWQVLLIHVLKKHLWHELYKVNFMRWLFSNLTAFIENLDVWTAIEFMFHC